MDGSVFPNFRLFSVFFPFFFIFPFFFRIFSVFQKRNPFFISNFRNKKDGQKTDKRRNFKILFSVFFPFFFRHFLKNPEKCRKKMVLFFSGNLRFVSVFGSKTEYNAGQNPENPLRIKSGYGNLRLFSKQFRVFGKKIEKTHKNRNPFFKNPKKFHHKKTGLRFFKNAKRNPFFFRF